MFSIDFTEEERLAIWIVGKRQCHNCHKPLPDISDMHADHEWQWWWGGPTSPENARCLCATCNTAAHVVPDLMRDAGDRMQVALG